MDWTWLLVAFGSFALSFLDYTEHDQRIIGVVALALGFLGGFGPLDQFYRVLGVVMLVHSTISRRRKEPVRPIT